MPIHPSSARESRRYALSLWLGLAVLAGLLIASFHKDRAEHEERHRQRSADTAATLARYAAIALDSADRTLGHLVADVAADPASLRRDGPLDARLKHVADAGHPAIGFGVADAAGTVVAMSGGLPPGATVSVADRGFFKQHRGDERPGTAISDPVVSKPSGLRIFALSRRIAAADGSFLGMVAATVQSERLFDVLVEIGPVPGTRHVIAREDGIVVACVPTCLLGADISDRPVMKAFRAGRRDGFGRGTSPLDGKEMIAAFRVVEGHPLIAISATPADMVGAAWWGSESHHIALAAILYVLTIAGVLRHLRLVRERVALEHARRRSSDDLLRASIESLNSGFAVFDAEQRLRLWNRRFGEMFPYLADELVVGTPARALAERTVDVRKPGRAADRRAAMIDSVVSTALGPRAPRPWFEHDDVRIEVSRSTTADGMSVLIYRDVTERERRESDLRRALHAEREMNAQQRRFVAIVSHEFRTPLTVIDGAAQIIGQLAAADAPPALVGRIERIRGAVRQMVELIDRVLSLARYSEGRISRQDADVDIMRLVREACERQRSITPEIAIDLVAETGPVILRCDPRLIEQVVVNILGNAVKFSGTAASVRVRVRIDDADVRIEISDSGIGIAAEDMPRLFDRFFRAKSSRGIAGTGLGLHLSHDLVAMHGGRIDVASRLGEGSTFTIRLPRDTAADAGQRSAA